MGERRLNALVFATAVAAYFVTFVETSGSAWLLLLIPLAGFGVRVIEPRVPAWLILVLTVSVVIGVNVGDLDSEGAFFLVCMGAFATTAVGSRWFPDRLLAVLAAASPIPVVLTDIPFDEWNWPFWSMGTVISAFFGGVLNRQRALTEELADAQDQLADQAAGEERRRIAREVHDLVGHSLTVVLLHVTGARRLVHRDPDEAERALEDAERVGRGALADIRRTVSMLREEGDTRTPTPTGQDLHTLVDESRAAGMAIADELCGPIDELDETTGLASYRIVQEALANVARHAPGATTRVGIDVTPDNVAIEIDSRGGRSPERPSDGEGNGLVGMQERATALGGSLTAGPTPDGWRVQALLPRRSEPTTVDAVS